MSVCLSARPSVRRYALPLDISSFHPIFEDLSKICQKKTEVSINLTRPNDISHEDQYTRTFMITSCLMSVRMINDSDQVCRQNKTLIIVQLMFSEKHAIIEMVNVTFKHNYIRVYLMIQLDNNCFGYISHHQV
jgi:hypothetical protein